VDVSGPQPGDSVESLLWDSVRCGASIDVPGWAAQGDAAPSPRSSSTMGPGVSDPLLPGSPDFPPLPIDWMWVRYKAESVCSHVCFVSSASIPR
jgi:hypothetical protein